VQTVKRHLKIIRFSQFILLFGAIALLPYCTSSPKTASNFGKRKYTKGHFSDRVAKVKTEYRPSENNSTITSTINNEHAVNLDDIISKSTTHSSGLKPNFSLPVSYGNQSSNQPESIPNSVSKSGTVSSAGKVSQSQNSSDFPRGGYADRIYNGPDAHTYLISWIVCILAGIILILLASILGFSEATLGLGCLLVVASVIFFAAAVVFFVLWLITILH
jgi:hypothetical protein